MLLGYCENAAKLQSGHSQDAIRMLLGYFQRLSRAGTAGAALTRHQGTLDSTTDTVELLSA